MATFADPQILRTDDQPNTADQGDRASPIRGMLSGEGPLAVPASPQEALRAAFANPREALNQAAIVAITDARGTIVAVNQKFCDLSGYTQDELVGRNHRLLKSGVHDRASFQELYRTITRGETWHGTLCNRAKGGNLYWMDITIVPNRSIDGGATALLCRHAGFGSFQRGQ